MIRLAVEAMGCARQTNVLADQEKIQQRKKRERPIIHPMVIVVIIQELCVLTANGKKHLVLVLVLVLFVKITNVFLPAVNKAGLVVETMEIVVLG